MFNFLKKVRISLPVSSDFHQEKDKLPLMELSEYLQFQALTGMLQRLHTIGRPDLDPLLEILGAHLKRTSLNYAMPGFVYLKFSKGHKIAIDSRALEFEQAYPDYEMLRPGFGGLLSCFRGGRPGPSRALW